MGNVKIINFDMKRDCTLAVNNSIAYDMFSVKLYEEHDDGTVNTREVKVFCDVDTLKKCDREKLGKIVLNALQERINKGQRNFYYLGRLEKTNDSYIMNNKYTVGGTNVKADAFFDYNCYNEIKNYDLNKCKSFYAQLESPFDDETIKELINIYLNNSFDKAGGLYSRVVNADVVDVEKKPEYVKKFEKEIFFPKMEKIFVNLKKEINEKEKNFEAYKKILDQFDSFEDFYNKIWKKDICHQIYNMCKLSKEPTTSEEVRESIIKKLEKITQEELNLIYYSGILFDYMKNEVGDKRNMGFQVTSSQYLDMPKVKDEIKFYINVGADSYKFASDLEKKGRKYKIPFVYKVANPMKYEFNRADRICVYTDIENADNVLWCIQELMKENPDLEYKKPPIFVGKIDKYIGVGSDMIVERKKESTSERNPSYNRVIANICCKAMEKIFAGYKKEEIELALKKNPSLITIVRNEILSLCKDYNLDKDKICITEDSVERLAYKNIQITRTKKLEK